MTSSGEIALATLRGGHPVQKAALRSIDFFTAHIRNPNTRAAYAIAVRNFFAWLEMRGVTELQQVRTIHVSGYIEALGHVRKAPTVKQHLAAIRMLFDFLIVGQIVDTNPAAAVRGPKHVVKRGRTPVLEADEARRLIDSINISTAVGLRDRALIALLIYTFARVSAAIGMNVEDYYPQGKRWWVRLHEKGGKQHDMPAHHLLETYLDEYVSEAGIAGTKASPLFRTTAGKTGRLTDRRMNRTDALYGTRLPLLPRDRHHGLSHEWRPPRTRSADGRARKRAHHKTLRSAQ